MRILKRALFDVLIWSIQGFVIGAGTISPLGILIVSDYFKHLEIGILLVLFEFLLLFTYLRYRELNENEEQS